MGDNSTWFGTPRRVGDPLRRGSAALGAAVVAAAALVAVYVWVQLWSVTDAPVPGPVLALGWAAAVVAAGPFVAAALRAAVLVLFGRRR